LSPDPRAYCYLDLAAKLEKIPFERIVSLTEENKEIFTHN